jgi:hypothetical protein
MQVHQNEDEHFIILFLAKKTLAGVYEELNSIPQGENQRACTRGTGLTLSRCQACGRLRGHETTRAFACSYGDGKGTRARTFAQV